MDTSRRDPAETRLGDPQDSSARPGSRTAPGGPTAVKADASLAATQDACRSPAADGSRRAGVARFPTPIAIPGSRFRVVGYDPRVIAPGELPPWIRDALVVEASA